MAQKNIQKLTAISGATTGTTVSATFWVGNYKRIGVLVRRGSHTSGTSAFTVKGGMDAFDNTATVTMTAYNLMVSNVTNTNAQNITNVNGTTLSANGDDFLWVNVMAPITHIQITSVVTTDGTASAFIIGYP